MVIAVFSVTILSSVSYANSKKVPKAVLDVLDLKNMDVLDVLKLISQKSGWNIVASQNVKGRVTVFLKDIEVEQALKIIVEAYGWAYLRADDVIKVITAQEYEAKLGYKFGQKQETRIHQLLYTTPNDLIGTLSQMKSASGKIIPDEKSSTLILIDEIKKLDEMESVIKKVDVATKSEVFQLSYAKAEDVSGKVSEILTPGVGKMRFDTRSNRIIISDTLQKITEISEVIEAFDQKDKEVQITAKILQIVLDDEHKMGVDWEGIVSDYNSLDLLSNFDILSETDKKGRLSIGTIANDDYRVLIEALDTVGVTNVLSNPSITVINNKEAKILIGSQEPYVTSTVTTPSSGPTTTAESINFIEVGVKLFVTPTIHEDDFITMKIKPEVSSVLRFLETSNNNSIPVVETSEAETTVLVKNNVTIVIGGLIKEEQIKSTRKVPVLGDIPLISFAFKNVSDQTSKSELVIFLTPKISTGDVEEDINFGLNEDMALYE